MPKLTGYAPLDVAIGLSFVYLLFSVLCSAVQEAIAGLFKWRANMLEEAVRGLLDDQGKAGEGGAPASVPDPKPDEKVAAPAAGRSLRPRRRRARSGGRAGGVAPGQRTVAAENDKKPLSAGKTLSAQVLGHGLIRPLYKENRKPSYLSPKLFALALLDIAAPAAGQDPIEDLGKQIALANLPGGVTDALVGITHEVANDRDKLREGVEDWFNGTMERVSGWYKRKTQIVICVLSLVATIALNINTLAIGEVLAKDGAVRAGVVAQAEKSTLKANATPKEAAKAISEVEELGVPVGWDKPAGDPARVSFSTWGGGFRTIGGWLLTFIALSLGAPFWFGLLNKLTNLRTSGEAPKTESKG